VRDDRLDVGVVRPVHRIAEVRTLRARQFPEDAGPLAHPVRPQAYRLSAAKAARKSSTVAAVPSQVVK
jgi:aminopeptidase N